MTPVTVSVVVVVVVVVVVSSSEVVVSSVVVLLSSLLFLAQEMTVRLKRDMRIMYKTLFIFSFTSIKWWGWFKGVILCMLHY